MGVVLLDLFILLHTDILLDYVAPVAFFIVGFGLKWLFGRKRLPTPALECRRALKVLIFLDTIN